MTEPSTPAHPRTETARQALRAVTGQPLAPSVTTSVSGFAAKQVTGNGTLTGVRSASSVTTRGFVASAWQLPAMSATMKTVGTDAGTPVTSPSPSTGRCAAGAPSRNTL